jgi:hypothetical protein
MLVTIGAVWLSAMLAGLSIAWLPDSPLATGISLASYAILLSAYAFGTDPGRRTRLPVFLIGGLLYPVAAFAWLVLIASLQPSMFESLGMPAAGLRIGFVVRGGPDAPLEFYLPYWAVNLLTPIFMVIGARGLSGRLSSRNA